MFGAVSGNLLYKIMKSEGYMEQLSFDFPPIIEINEKYLTSVSKGYKFNEMSSHGSVDHPAFSELRDHLESRGYISTERGWSNGDRVLKPFYLNGKYFEEEDAFPCATAMGGMLSID
jgi:hypothetical protein